MRTGQLQNHEYRIKLAMLGMVNYGPNSNDDSTDMTHTFLFEYHVDSNMPTIQNITNERVHQAGIKRKFLERIVKHCKEE